MQRLRGWRLAVRHPRIPSGTARAGRAPRPHG
jgi:hypothetical protein